MNPFPRLDINELSDNTKPIVYQITDWFIPETDKNKGDYESDDNYTIYIYGTTEDNITVCTKVVNFKPFFYVKPPAKWQDLNEKDLKQKVKDFQSKLLNDSYDSKFKGGKTFKKKIIGDDYQTHFHKIELVSKKDFWGFTNNTNFKFLKIVVNSLYMYNNLKYFFQSDGIIKEGFKLYESNIDPFLRFIHMKEIKPCGWIQVSNYDYQDNIPDTKCNYNLTADWNDIQAMDINKIAPLIVASFDIECTSSHGDFPVAIKNYKKLAQDLCYLSKGGFDNANLLDNIYRAYFEEVKIKDNYIINRLYSKIQVTEDVKKTLKENEAGIRFILSKVKSVEIPDDDFQDEDDIDKPDTGSKKLTSKEYNEIEDSLNKLLSDILPALEGDKIIQIGITVNKFGSDEIIYKQMISLNDCDDIDGVNVKCCKTESELLLYWKRFMDKLNPDVIIGYNIWGFDIEYIWDRSKELGINGKFKMGLGRIRNRTCNLVEQKLSSSALGDNIFKLIETDGIVCIDLFKVIQKDFKLDSYKLDNVASIYIGENKDDLKPNEIFEKFKGNSADRCVIAKYCIQDCVLINKLLHKLKIVENNIGMGNVCLVPLNYLFRRGQGIKIFSLVANECMKKNYLIPVIKNFIIDDDVEGYEGAIVLDPKEGIYLDEPIVVFDYGSLYPSSMICRNLSHDTYILDDKYKDIKDDNVEIIKVSYDLYEGKGDNKEKSGVKDCYFARYKNGEKGVIPDILEMLLNQRKNTRKKIEYTTVETKDGLVVSGFMEESDNEVVIIDVDLNKKTKIKKSEIISQKQTYNKFECAVFDALQNAYKVTANSLYGQIGARTSPIYLKDIAACTTSTGREMIMLAKNFVESNYDADVIYGDTDSIFCKFKIKDENGFEVTGKDALAYAIKIGQEVEAKIKKHLPYPQKLNYEKSLFPFILFSKKRYVGNLYENDPNAKPKQKSMGIVLKRRDNANIVKKVFGGIIDIILNKHDLNHSIQFLRDELKDLVEGKTDMKDLILSKTLRGFYKDPTRIAHKVLADRIAVRDPGNKPAVNDRIQYVYIKNKEGKLQGDKIETPEYIIENKLEPDYLHYITNQIMKPVLQLYVLCLQELDIYSQEPDYWMKIEEELKQKDMYKDDTRRKNRLENLKLLKVQELLFDEFILKLKEPKVSKRATKATTSKTKTTTKATTKTETITESSGDILSGEIRITESKSTKMISYKVKIEKEMMNGEVPVGETKEKVLKKLLSDIYDKYPTKIIEIKLNYKAFIKDYNYFKTRFNNLAESKSLGLSEVTEQNKIIKNDVFIKIKDNIILKE
jgi:DNA polymerase delta subunit 1